MDEKEGETLLSNCDIEKKLQYSHDVEQLKKANIRGPDVEDKLL